MHIQNRCTSENSRPTGVKEGNPPRNEAQSAKRST